MKEKKNMFADLSSYNSAEFAFFNVSGITSLQLHNRSRFTCTAISEPFNHFSIGRLHSPGTITKKKDPDTRACLVQNITDSAPRYILPGSIVQMKGHSVQLISLKTDSHPEMYSIVEKCLHDNRMFMYFPI